MYATEKETASMVKWEEIKDASDTEVEMMILLPITSPPVKI